REVLDERRLDLGAALARGVALPVRDALVERGRRQEERLPDLGPREPGAEERAERRGVALAGEGAELLHGEERRAHQEEARRRELGAHARTLVDPGVRRPGRRRIRNW